jgi:UDP-N-acetylmuramoylalanine--D-glutamate ligase
MIDLKHKKVAVFGLGVSGIAAIKKLSAMGARVFASEAKPETAFNTSLLSDLRTLSSDLEFGGHTLKAIENTALIVVSPGIHLDLPVFTAAREKGIPILAEIELAYRILSKPIIAVTGTNGKTTTTTLIGEMLTAAGKKVAVAGNIGAPLIGVEDADLDYVVAEISSYQLEGTHTFRPFISVLLNIQPDHLERHHTLEKYAEQKARVFLQQDANDYLVYNADDPAVCELVKDANPIKMGFSKSNPSSLGMPAEEIKIPGRHNLENALAAAETAKLCKVSAAVIANVLRTFSGVPHRIELVKEVKGVRFYNDSKATNPDSALVALETFSEEKGGGRKVILILGGRDKGVSLDVLCQKVKQTAKAVILIGEAEERFRKELEKLGVANMSHAGSMQEAVRLAYRLAQKGDVVLLSPACASFDMFTNYEERGDAFRQAVSNIQE